MLATGPALRVRWIGHSGRRIRNGENIALALQSAPELTLHHDPADTLPNARPVFDRYRTIREIGSGGMATVYLADDLKHNRRVAIKVMKPALVEAIGQDRFLREIEIAARLNHPHVVPLFDSGAAGEALFYVMPYVDGESLRARLQREAQLPLDEALRLAREISSALSHAHHHGLVHRDIKPENILLADGIALVADFGIARSCDAGDADRTQAMTVEGGILGTPLYMSPEQACGDRSDLRRTSTRSPASSLKCSPDSGRSRPRRPSR